MNWKEKPELFANGKFRVKSGGATYLFDGWSYSRQWIRGLNVARKNSGFDMIFPEYENVKLIARPISDMEEDEYDHHQQIIYTIRDDVYGKVMYRRESVESFLYLISIGVYPFDQEAFESGDVIDITTMKEAGQ